MTAYKLILTPLAEVSDASVTLETALRLGGLFQSHVKVLHVRPDPTSAIPMIGEGLSGVMVDEMINAADTQGREVTSKVRAVYDEVLRRLDIPEAGQPLARLSASWTEKLGREDDEVCHLARVSDLVVLPTPDPDFDGVASLTVNAVLLEGGRPVLLAPKVLPATIGTRIAIAWNGSAEGARAVSDALPLLQQAKLVTVLHVTEEEGGLISAQELVDYLAWQGVTADIHAVSPKGHGAGETLVAAATDWQADLLVMGAYTHSRLRQLIMGGVTRHVLHHAKMPVLLSH